MTHCATYWIMTTRAVKGISNFRPQGDTAIRLTVQQDVLREVDARKSLRCVLAVHVLRKRASGQAGQPRKTIFELTIMYVTIAVAPRDCPALMKLYIYRLKGGLSVHTSFARPKKTSLLTTTGPM